MYVQVQPYSQNPYFVINPIVDFFRLLWSKKENKGRLETTQN